MNVSSNSITDKSLAYPIQYICCTCNESINSRILSHHIRSCKKSSRLLHPLFKLVDCQHSSIKILLKSKINSIRLTINKILKESSTPSSIPSSTSSLTLICTLNKTLRKLIPLEHSSHYSLSQVFTLEKCLLFTSYPKSLSSPIKIHSISQEEDHSYLIEDYFKLYHEFTTKNKDLTSISLDGDLLAYSNSGFISIIDLKKNLKIFSMAKTGVQQVEIIERYKFLAFSCEKCLIKVINFHDYTLVCKLFHSKYPVTNFVVSGNKEFIFANCQSKSIVVWNIFSLEKTVVKADKANCGDCYEVFFVISEKNDFFLYFYRDIVVYDLQVKAVRDKVLVDRLIYCVCLIEDDKKILYSTQQRLMCYSIVVKEFVFSIEIYSMFFVDAECKFLLFESGQILDLLQNKFNNEQSTTSFDINFLQTPSTKIFSKTHHDSKSITRGSLTFTLNDGEPKIVPAISQNPSIQIPNIFSTSTKFLHYFATSSHKILITSSPRSAQLTISSFIHNKTKLFIFDFNRNLNSMALSHDKKFIYFYKMDTIEIWNTFSQQKTEKWFNLPKSFDSCGKFNNFNMIKSQKFVLVRARNHFIHVFRVFDKEKIDFFESKVVDFEKQGKKMAFIVKKDFLQVFDLEELIMKWSSRIKELDLNGVLFSKIGKYLMVITNSRSFMFDKQSFKVEVNFDYPEIQEYDMKVSYGEVFVVLATRFKAVLLLLERPPEYRSFFNTFIKCVDQIGFSADNENMIISGEIKSFVYEIDSGSLKHIIDHFNPIFKSVSWYTFPNSDYFTIFFNFSTAPTDKKTAYKSQPTSGKFIIINIKSGSIHQEVDCSSGHNSSTYFNPETNTLRYISGNNILIIEIIQEPVVLNCKLDQSKIYQSLFNQIYSISCLNLLKQYISSISGTSQSKQVINKLFYTCDNSKLILLNHSCLRIIKNDPKESNLGQAYLNEKIKNFIVFKDKFIIFQMINLDIKICYLDNIYEDCELKAKIIQKSAIVLNFDNYYICVKEGKRFIVDPELKVEQGLYKLLPLFHEEKTEIFLTENFSYLIDINISRLEIINLRSGHKNFIRFGRFDSSSLKVSKNLNFIALLSEDYKLYLIKLFDLSRKIFTSINDDTEIILVTDKGDVCINSIKREEFSIIPYNSNSN